MKTTTILKLKTYLFFLFTTCAFTQNFEWANSAGSAAHDEGEAVVIDHDGHIYIMGYFKDELEFNQTNVPSIKSNGDRDILIQKMDADGNILWAKQIGGPGEDLGTSMIIDNDNNLYLTGSFEGTADFNPGPEQTLLSSNGAQDSFVLKLDSNGILLWANTVGGSRNDSGRNLALDATGNLYLAGEFSGTVDFDSGPGEVILTATSNLGVTFFMQKLDANGGLVWTKDMALSPTSGMVVDPTGNIYRTGYFSESVDFDPGTGETILTATPSSGSPFPLPDVYIQKLNTNGDLLWVRRIGGPGFDIGASIALDSDNNLITTGGFEGTLDFDPGAGQMLLTSKEENPYPWLQTIFMQKLDVNGNTIWAKALDVTPDASMKIDAEGNIYRVGYFLGTQDFDPGPGITNLVSTGVSTGRIFDADTFIQKLDTNGNFVWASSTGGSRNDFAYAIDLDENGNMYTTGFFGGTVDFDPGTGIFNLSSEGSGDIFVRKLSQIDTGTGSGDIDTIENSLVMPNPAHHKIHVYLGPKFKGDLDKVYITILDGGSGMPVPSLSRNHHKHSCIDFEVKSFHSGLYVVRVTFGEEQKTLKFIKK